MPVDRAMIQVVEFGRAGWRSNKIRACEKYLGEGVEIVARGSRGEVREREARDNR